MAHDEDDFRIRPGKVRDRNGGRASARRIGGMRRRPGSFLGEVHQAIRRAGGNPDRLSRTRKGSGRFNARGRGAATVLELKDRSAWSRDASGRRTRSRRVAVKARVVKLNPQRGAARGRQFVSAKAVDAHLRYLERDGVTKDGEKGQVYRPVDDNGSPNGMSLNPRILRIACATPKEDCKVRDSFPAFVHGAESLRDNSFIVAKSESPYERRGMHHPMPARMQATAEDKRTVEDRPTRDYLETTRAFWQPYAERELTREDAREMARNLIGFFTVLREWTLRERERARCGAVETILSSPRRKRGRLRTRAATKDRMQS